MTVTYTTISHEDYVDVHLMTIAGPEISMITKRTWQDICDWVHEICPSTAIYFHDVCGILVYYYEPEVPLMFLLRWSEALKNPPT